MTWEIKVFDEFERDIVSKIVDDVIEVVEESGVSRGDMDAFDEVVYDIAFEECEGWFVYYVDQLAALVHYGHINDGFDACWEDIVSDVCSKARERFLG